MTDWKKVYVMLRPPPDVAAAAAAARRDAVAQFEQARRDSVESGMGRQRYELLPLAVRHGLMERRDARREQHLQQLRQQRHAVQMGGGSGSSGGGGKAAAGEGVGRQRRLPFTQRPDGGQS
jgi:hypothetical protein